MSTYTKQVILYICHEKGVPRSAPDIYSHNLVEAHGVPQPISSSEIRRSIGSILSILATANVTNDVAGGNGGFGSTTISMGQKALGL